MAFKELTLPVLISLGGALVSYGAMKQTVAYAEKTAEKAADKAGKVEVLDERTKTIQTDVQEIRQDIKKILAK